MQNTNWKTHSRSRTFFRNSLAPMGKTKAHKHRNVKWTILVHRTIDIYGCCSWWCQLHSSAVQSNIFECFSICCWCFTAGPKLSADGRDCALHSVSEQTASLLRGPNWTQKKESELEGASGKRGFSLVKRKQTRAAVGTEFVSLSLSLSVRVLEYCRLHRVVPSYCAHALVSVQRAMATDWKTLSSLSVCVFGRSNAHKEAEWKVGFSVYFLGTNSVFEKG